MIARILFQSFKGRRYRLLISLLALTFTVTLMLILGHIDGAVQRQIQRFSGTADLMVSAQSQPTQLVLFSLFGIGPPPPPLNGSLLDKLVDHPEIERVTPVSMMESHRGFQVVGTNDDYLQRELASSGAFPIPDTFGKGDAVLIGARVAKTLGYKLGEQLTIANGLQPDFSDEYRMPFTIQAVLPETGSLIDDILLVSLEGLKQARSDHGVEPDVISYFNIHLYERKALLALQHSLPNLVSDPVITVIPAQELEKLYRYGQWLKQVMVSMNLAIGALAMVLVFFNLVAGFTERRQELELLRMVGMKPHQMALLTLAEPVLHLLVAALAGIILYLPASLLLGSWLPQLADGTHLTASQLISLVQILAAGFVLASLPALLMYRFSRRI